MSQYMVLGENHNVIPADLHTWGRWYEKFENRQVARETVMEGVEVSTVFLGIDHSFGYGPSLWFETMVFGGDLDGEVDRYTTWDQAVAGHKAMVARCAEPQSDDR